MTAQHSTRLLTVLVAVLSVATVIVPGSPAVAAPAGPVVAAANSDPVAIATGDRHSCVLTQEGRVWCWGANDRGQLGRPDPERSATPVLVEGPRNVTQIAAGGAHTCAVAGDTTWCWGANGSGQLGDGTTRDRLEPVRSLAAGITQLSAGRSHTCGVAENGSHEVQSLVVSATRGTFTLGYGGSDTGAIAWNAGAAAIQSALDALSANWAAEVRERAGGGYAIVFNSGSLANQDIPQLTADSRGLRGADAAVRMSTVTDGGWRLLCWGADNASQLGRGPLDHAGLVPDAIATDPASGDLYVADTEGHRVWRFSEDATFAQLLALDYGPLAVGTAEVMGRSKVYAASADDGDGVVGRYDLRTGEIEAVYRANQDNRVVPSGWTCHCLITAMTVDPASGAVFIVLSGTVVTNDALQNPAPFAKLVRVDSEQNSTDPDNPALVSAPGEEPIDLLTEFPGVKAFTDLAVGADNSGAPILYALQSPAQSPAQSPEAGGIWRISLWDIGAGRLARRTSFAVSPDVRGSADGSYTSACPARTVTTPVAEDETWTRRVRTGTFDFGRIGPAGDGDVGVVTRYGYVEQKQKADDPDAGEDEWTDVADSKTVVKDLDACVNVFSAGSQGNYGRYRTTLRGARPGGSQLGPAPTDTAAAPDGRILVADPENGRIQQFSADGDPIGQWPGSQYSAVPTGSPALRQVLTQEALELTAVSAGDAHTCVSTSEGQAVAKVLCWGSNTAGQLDYTENAAKRSWIPARDPETTGSVTGFPVIAWDPDVGGIEVQASIVAAGGAHTCTDRGLTGVGTGTTCWGDNGLGQLGPPTDGPIVVTDSLPELIAAGGSGTCLALGDGSAECRGPAVLQVQGLDDVTALDVGERHACAIRRGGAAPARVLCWGANGWDQTGPEGDGTARAVEVPLSPRIEASGPAALDAPIVVDFQDETSAVSSSSFRLADSDGRVVAVTVSCRTVSAAPVGCAGDAVRSADLSPRGGIVAGERYGLTVSPNGDLESGGVTIPPTDFEITGPVSLSSKQLGTSYSWATRSDASAYGGSVLVEEARGATLSYAFTGPRLTWYTRRGPGEGLATVLVDGVVRSEVDNSATKRRNKVPIKLTGLGKGPHTVTIRVAGKRGIRARGRAVTVDAFRAGSLSKSPAASMTWGRSTLGERVVRRAETKGSQVSFRFRGSQVAWHTLAAVNAGRAEVLLDGVVVQRFNGYDDIAEPRPATVVVPAGPGVHRLSVVATGKGSGKRHFAYVDAFEVTP